MPAQTLKQWRPNSSPPVGLCFAPSSQDVTHLHRRPLAAASRRNPSRRKLARDGAQAQALLIEWLDHRQREGRLSCSLLGVRPHARRPRLRQPWIAELHAPRFRRRLVLKDPELSKADKKKALE